MRTEQAPVNLKWNGSGADPRLWRKLPGSTEKAEYTVELIPAAGYPQCVENNQYSMVDTNGNLTVRVTGRSRGEYRSVLATLRRSNFIDFIYFTHFETLDPSAYPTAADTLTATAQCSVFRAARTGFCTEIQFASTDVIEGPFHTNDNARVCGSATFGRNTRDAIEISGTPPFVDGSCGADPERGRHPGPPGEPARHAPVERGAGVGHGPGVQVPRDDEDRAQRRLDDRHDRVRHQPGEPRPSTHDAAAGQRRGLR